MNPTIKILLAEETVQQLLLAGYQSDHIDYGFAFDRAVIELEASQEVEAWTEKDYDDFKRELKIQACIADVLRENMK